MDKKRKTKPKNTRIPTLNMNTDDKYFVEIWTEELSGSFKNEITGEAKTADDFKAHMNDPLWTNQGFIINKENQPNAI